MTSQLECCTDGNLAPDPEPEAQQENTAQEKKNRILQQHFEISKTPSSVRRRAQQKENANEAICFPAPPRQILQLKHKFGC